MAGRDEGTGALIEPRTNRACRGLAPRIIRHLKSFTQWWVRLTKPHTQNFGHSLEATGIAMGISIFVFPPCRVADCVLRTTVFLEAPLALSRRSRSARSPRSARAFGATRFFSVILANSAISVITRTDRRTRTVPGPPLRRRASRGAAQSQDSENLSRSSPYPARPPPDGPLRRSPSRMPLRPSPTRIDASPPPHLLSGPTTCGARRPA